MGKLFLMLSGVRTYSRDLRSQTDINTRPLDKPVCLEERLQKEVQAGFSLEEGLTLRSNMPFWG